MDGARSQIWVNPGVEPTTSDDHSAPRTAHLIGIAGSGMRSLAAVLIRRGWRISGSDTDQTSSHSLARLGATIYDCHAALNVPVDAQLVIHSDAIPADNIERRRAAELAIPAKSYPEMLAELGHGSATFAVAGTHGKSTTTAMAAAAMVRAGLDPTVICGASPIGCLTGGRAGAASLLLVESCEYRANFLRLRPDVAVVLGVEQDHFDFFRSRRQLSEAFRRFAGQVRPEGLLLVNHDCRTSRRLTRDVNCWTRTFGFDRRADWTAKHLQTLRGRYRFWLVERGRPLAEVALQVPGKHNVSNALAAAALATAAGASADTIAAALSSFRGIRRRIELVGRRGGITFIDDYAHHPTEIHATLTTVRQMYPGRRIWCVFQPHQVSRTASLLDELAASLHNADKIAVAEIFRAREPSVRPGDVTAADLAAAVAAAGDDVLEEHDWIGIVRRVAAGIRPGDVLITMGAGDIGKIRQAIYQRLRKDRARS
ncbi:MAG TPA: UDP-N-acetylmuramate--L-alanine ligase [Pirellulales bacterium]|jgi:UDP-N-acetylmuramate--alanine ligase|nr:UDP-N-acetylmuramate--L-alanine ligase [Pirellulales bacterium]